MAKPASRQKHLKIYTEHPPKDVRPQIEAVACLPDLSRGFREAIGWELQYVPSTEKTLPGGLAWSTAVSAGSEFTPGSLCLKKAAGDLATDGPETSTRPFPAELDTARTMAGPLADLLSELMQTRRALWQREAELAAGVPLVPHREEEKHLASRIEAVLKTGVEAVGADAVALYLLDDATTELKMRSSFGLPFDRLLTPARPLQGAVADLEALLGHAVVLNDEQLIRVWNMPEDFAAGVCVPVSTATTLLGTLWVFSNEKRDFNDRETNLLEVIAGRLASDLEREMLLRAGTDGANLMKQVAAAERLQRNGLPTLSPLLDNWSIAGWTSQAEGVGGAFHDWFSLPRGLLAVAVGKAVEHGMAGAITANTVKTAVRAHTRYQHQAERVLQQVNMTLWAGSAGDQHAALFCGLLETATGRVCCASAGHPSVLRLRGDGWDSLSHQSLSLGASAEADFEQFGYELQPGEALVIFTESVREAQDNQGIVFGEERMAEALLAKLSLSADELTALAHDAYATHAATTPPIDVSIVVIKRQTA